jgi:hypothetical protein
LLNSNNILHGRQEVEKEKYIPDEDLNDMRTSLVAANKAVASEERHVVEDDILSTNLAYSLYNQHYVQSGENRAYCNLIPSGVD